MQKRALWVLFGMSANVRGEYAEGPLNVKKTVNEIQTQGHQVLLSLHKKVLTTEGTPSPGGAGQAMKANQSKALWVVQAHGLTLINSQ